LTLELFGGEVRSSANELTVSRVIRGKPDRESDPEIDESDAAGVIYEHVARLDVSVHDASSVHLLERLPDLDAQRQHVLHGWLVEGTELREGVTLDEFHHQERSTLGGPGIEYGDQTGMVQPREGARLPHKTRLVHFPPRVCAEHLDGHVTVEKKITSTKHIRHAAPADRLSQLIPVSDK
jgi:hypothetical protein